MHYLDIIHNTDEVRASFMTVESVVLIIVIVIMIIMNNNYYRYCHAQMFKLMSK